MDILILADFLGPLDGTFNSRFLYLGDMLAKEHEVEIVTSDFDHGAKAYFDYEIEKHDFKITMLHKVFPTFSTWQAGRNRTSYSARSRL